MAEGIGENIRRLLIEKKIKQKDVAEYLGVSNGTFSDWLRGRHIPKSQYIVAMAKYFEVTPLELTTKRAASPTEDRLTALFDSLTEDQKAAAIDYMKYLIQKGQE